MIVCPSCGQENPDGFRFCGACAASLEKAPPAREERKVVTVLFADLVGFTSQAEKLDPEEVRAILRPYHERLRADIERYGGTVEKFIGDAVMAVFGAPVAHEDDPERAVRAALVIRDALVDEGELHVRVGITTGEALVTLGARPEAGEGMVAGDVVNTAARLQTAAPVDGVLVDATTYRATERVIEYRTHEPVLAKGKVEPVTVWQAVAPRARYGTDVRHIGRASLVGRANELEALLNALARVREREPQLVTLVGVPGIGKSRLVWELFRRAEAEPELVTWRQGRSLPYGDGVSFWALAEMVKAHAGILETDSPEEAERKLQEIAPDPWTETHLRPLVGLEAHRELGGDRRSEAFAAWRGFFERVAAGAPLVLVFEDLHWADDGLLDFIDHLVDWVSGVPLLVVATARPELLARRPGWGGGKANAVTLSLQPLSDDETARLVHALLERAVLPAQTQQTLLDRAGGNPLYAEEFVRLAADRREDVTLPESVQGIIAARLDSLAGDEKALLQDAAVLGKVFWLGGLGRERWRAEELLHGLERKDFVRRDLRSSVAGETEYAFRHALVRDVAYEQIPHAERADRHRRAAEWIESLGRPEDHAEMLAHHYLAALAYAKDDPSLAARAIPVLRHAGDRAFGLNAFGQAARFYDHALELGAVDPELLFRLAQALHLMTDERAAQALVRARDAAIAAGDAERAAEAESLLAEIWWYRGDADRCAQHLARAHELVREAGASPAKARVLSGLARHHALAEESQVAIERGEEALALAEQLGLVELQAHALSNIGTAKSSLGDHAAGIAALERSVELAVSINSPEAARGYNTLAALLFAAGDARRACATHEQALEVAERLGNALVARYVRSVLSAPLYAQGRWDEALRLIDEYVAEVAGDRHVGEAFVRMWRALIRLARDDTAGAVDDVEVSVDLARGGNPQFLYPALAIASRVYTAVGDDGRARQRARELLAELERVPVVGRLWFAYNFLLVARELNLADDARAVVAQAEHESLWVAAAGAALEGRFVDLAEIFEQTGYIAEEAYARLRAAEQLAYTGGGAEAAAHLQKALAFYRSVGATRYVREAESLLAATA